MDSLGTLFEVLYTLTKLMAPFTPFLTEAMYQNLRNGLAHPEVDHDDRYKRWRALRGACRRAQR